MNDYKLTSELKNHFKRHGFFKTISALFFGLLLVVYVIFSKD